MLVADRQMHPSAANIPQTPRPTDISTIHTLAHPTDDPIPICVRVVEAPPLLLLRLLDLRLLDRLHGRVPLAEAIEAEGHVLLLLLLWRVAGHPLVLLGVGGLLLHLVLGHGGLLLLLLVEVGLRRILGVVLLLSLVGRLPRGQPAAEGHYVGLMSESWR